MQKLVKLLKNSLYGQSIRKNFEETFACKPEYWMMTEYDEWVKGFWKIGDGKYFVKMIDGAGLED